MTTPQMAAGRSPKSRFERVVEFLAEGLGNSIGWLAEHGVLFVVFALLWTAFLAALVLNPAALTDAWHQVGTLPIYVQLVVWLLFLPIMAGLWIWQTDWPDFVRIALIVALAAWTLLVMRPTRRGARSSGTS